RWAPTTSPSSPAARPEACYMGAATTAERPPRGAALCPADPLGLHDRLEDDGLVVLPVLGAEHERDDAAGAQLPEPLQVLAPVQFRPVAIRELLEPLGVVREPLAQVLAGCQTLGPPIYGRALLRDAPGPDPVHEHPRAVVLRLLVVRPLELHHAASLAP